MKEALDTRFFMELIYSDDSDMLQRCRSKLTSLRRSGQGLIPAPVLAEVVHQSCETMGRAAAEQHRQAILHSGLRLVDVDADVAADAGFLKCRHRRAPFADCLIAAIALREKARVITDDPHFADMEGLKVGWL